jgi:GWxTD domain-containing protein
MERQNVASLYQTASPFALAQDHQIQNDSLIWWIKLPASLLYKQALPADLRMTLTLQPGYSNQQVLWQDTVRNLRKKTFISSKEAIIRTSVNLSKLPPGKLLSAQLISPSNAEQPLVLDLPLTQAALQKRHVLLNARSRQPLFHHFLNPSDTATLVSSIRADSALLKRYKVEFIPAHPPMASREPVVAPTLPLLDTRKVKLGEPFILIDPGFYSIQMGMAANSGILLVGENKYPDLSTAKELIDPLRYLTTSKERDELYKAEDPKKAVDNFWLEAAGNATLARNLIRTYYSRVADANRLFTSHKPGWMTDRGMIFIGLGQPAEVHRFDNREEWSYLATDAHPAVVFIFLRKEQPLTQNHFELVRDPIYEPIWYEVAERWRKGIIDQ